MTFTVIFNGTGDTYYESDEAYLKANKLECIEKGTHTLSFFADCIKIGEEQLEEPLLSRVKINNNHLLTFNNERAIIKGADDSGTEVHNLIITGLMATLNAILRGEQAIFFLGFSRGSVEAIHMTHELQRIKNYLTTYPDSNPDSLVTAISQDCYHSWRTNFINSYYKDALLAVLKEPNSLQTLKDGLLSPDFKFSGMLLDPVPGMCEGSSYTYIAWNAMDHHTEIPPIVDELTVAYMSDERSVGFRAVWIEAAQGSQTKVNRFHLPGFHGTANGNPVNHSPSETLKSEALFPWGKMRDVQCLYFYKLLQFASKHQVVFHKPEKVADRYLTSVFVKFLEEITNIKAQNEYLISLNDAIATNLIAYRQTQRTSYLPSLIGGTEDAAGERIIMTKTGSRSLSECFDGFNIKDASVYINFESFLLDFITVLFPELTDSRPNSSAENLSYSGINHRVSIRYDSASPSTEDYSMLTNKISTLLKNCQSHDLEDKLNKIILNDKLDNKGILSRLVELSPVKLANAVYHPRLTESDIKMLQNCIFEIIDFNMVGLNEDNQNSEPHCYLLLKKHEYIQKFKDNMQHALLEQTTHTLNNLLRRKNEFLCCEATPTPEDMSEAATGYSGESNHYMIQSPSSFDALTYVKKADMHYRALIEFKVKFGLIRHIFTTEQRYIDNFIDEEISQFPGTCERVLRAKIGNEFSAEILTYYVMQPLQAPLELAKKYQDACSEVSALRSSEVSLRQSLYQATVKNSSLTDELHSSQSTHQTLRTDKDELSAQLESIRKVCEEKQKELEKLQEQNRVLGLELEAGKMTISEFKINLASSQSSLQTLTLQISQAESESIARYEENQLLQARLLESSKLVEIKRKENEALGLEIQTTKQTLESRIEVLQIANDQLTHTNQDINTVGLAYVQDATALRQQLDAIRNILYLQSTGFLSGFTLQLISNLSIILGLMITTLAAACLIAGTGGVVMPALGAVAGSGIALLGVFGLKTGHCREHAQQLNETFFPI